MLGIHPQALALRGERANLLANNIANADTPGFKARDIDFKSVLAAQQNQNVYSTNTRLNASNPKHLAGSQEALHGEDLKYRTPLMPSLDGNSVDIQLEQTEFAQNSLQFMASLRFVNGKFQGMMSAIKGE